MPFELKVLADPELRGLYQALKQGEVRWRDLMDEKRDGEKGEETSKLQKALAAQEAKKAKPAPAAAAPTPPESDAARFYRLMNEAQDVAALERILDDARATLKPADLSSAENYAIDRRAALGGLAMPRDEQAPFLVLAHGKTAHGETAVMHGIFFARSQAEAMGMTVNDFRGRNATKVSDAVAVEALPIADDVCEAIAEYVARGKKRK